MLFLQSRHLPDTVPVFPAVVNKRFVRTFCVCYDFSARRVLTSKHRSVISASIWCSLPVLVSRGLHGVRECVHVVNPVQWAKTAVVYCLSLFAVSTDSLPGSRFLTITTGLGQRSPPPPVPSPWPFPPHRPDPSPNRPDPSPHRPDPSLHTDLTLPPTQT